MKKTIGSMLILFLSACGQAFALVESAEDPEPTAIIIDYGEFTPPPADTVVVEPPDQIQPQPTADAGVGGSWP